MADLEKPNYLLVASMVGVAAYWITAPLVSNPYLSVFCSMLLMIGATLALIQYAPDAYRVVFKRWRSNDPGGRGRGSHLAIYGIFIIAFGSVFSGTYALWWATSGQPGSWIGSAAANFGRACHAIGFAMMQVSPNVTRTGVHFTRSWIAIAIGATILILIGFWIGVSVRIVEASDSMQPWRPFYSGRAMCPADAIWGSANRIYHTKASPYRDLVIPRWCFINEAQARREGFRAPAE